MSTKELVIEVRVPLSEGIFESADVIAKVRSATDDLRESLADKIGDNFEMRVETATKRAPRQANGTARLGRPRKAISMAEPPVTN